MGLREDGAKYCSGCDEFLSRSAFARDNSHSDGLKSNCRNCRGFGAVEYQQKKLELRYTDGDTKVDLCSCGSFYVNEKFINKLQCSWEIYYECKECREITAETLKTKVDDRWVE